MGGAIGGSYEPGGSGAPALTIDDVIAQLSTIVDWSRANRSRIGYFAAMYRKVTQNVKRGIEDGEFEDAARMSRLVIVFAQRYLDAFRRYQAGERPTRAWQVSLAATRRWRPIIVQQLLTGMNVHINLDLGIAASTVSPGAGLASLQRDFDKINDILAEMTNGFVSEVASVSPWIGLLDRFGGRADQVLIEFSIEKAREAAWRLATQLAPLEQSEQHAPIGARDDWAARFNQTLLWPGWLLGLGLLLVRLRETHGVSRVIDVLAGD
jgi:hypothetical protein